ncbi:MAG: radical SAM protein [Myxococcales bacterium]|nr:radical SAM protein [Myxococcales bacterium]
MTEALFYADSPAENDSFAGAGAFAAAVAALRDGAPARLVPTPANFWRLGRTARLPLSLRGVGLALPDFQPADHQRLGEPFRRHLEELRARLAGTPVAVADPSPELNELLARYDAHLTPATRPNLLRLLGAVSDGCFIGPHTFHLDISNRCNTNCIFCGLHSPLLVQPKKPIRGRRFTEGWATRLVDLDLFTELVDDLAAIGTREDILFSGEGEPLLHPNFAELVRLVRGKDLSLTVFSNGLALDERFADLFVETDLNILYWSLSAATAATFARQQPAHGPEKYAAMLRQFADLVKKKRARRHKPYLIMAHVINRLNAHECEAAMDLAAEIGVDAVRYQVMHLCGDSMRDLLITPEQYAEARRQIERARLVAERHGIAVVANIDFQLARIGEVIGRPDGATPDLWSRDLYQNSGCLAGWFFSRSFTDGRISFCCHDKIVGSLRRGRFRDLWFAERYRKLRQAAKAFSAAVNPDLTDESCGGPLLGPDCDSCGNYEFINQALADLDRYGLRPFLRREPPAWP